MRVALVIVVLAGCRQILGFEDPVLQGPPDDATIGNESIGNESNGSEMTAATCPGNYNLLPNSGSRGHYYRFVAQSLTWSQHRDGCAAAGTAAGKTIFLAFPDGPQAAMELAALRVIDLDGTWIGVDDIVQEGMYRNTLGAPVSTQTQALINTTGTIGDCMLINGTTIDDTDCTELRRAICECVP